MITEILNRLRLGESSFILNGSARGEYTYLFMTADAGKGKFVYVASSFKGNIEDFLSPSSLSAPKVFAIFVDNILYIFDLHAVDIPYSVGYEILNDIDGALPLPTAELSEKAINWSNEFIENLVVPADFKYNVAVLEKSVFNARLGSLDTSYREFSYNIPVDEAVKILCDIDDRTEDALKEDIISMLEEKREYYTTQKAYEEKVKKILSEEILSPEEADEVTLSKVMRSSTAKYVNVTFDVDGIILTGKVEPSRILRVLTEKSDFSSWNFSTNVSGEKILNEYIKHFGRTFKLRCKHIKTIDYGKKIIYSRTA